VATTPYDNVYIDEILDAVAKSENDHKQDNTKTAYFWWKKT